jgi:hypothetical protein
MLKSFIGWDKRGRDIRITSLAIRDMEVPTEAEMIHILDTIDQALTEDRPVYVHCWGGHGRTGTVVGCYLRRHDLVSARTCLDISATFATALSKVTAPPANCCPAGDGEKLENEACKVNNNLGSDPKLLDPKLFN